MSGLNLSTLDRIQLEIKESIQREKELKNGYSTVNTDSNINSGPSVNGVKNHSRTKSMPLTDSNNVTITRSNTNGFRKFTQNTSGPKGVMHKFIKSRGRFSLSAINTENQNSWASDAAFKPAKITVEKGGKSLRNGYVSAEEKMKKELQDFQQRELQLREERKKSQPNLMAALQLEDDNEFDEYGCNLNGGLKATKSMANLYNNSDDGYEDTSSSAGGSLKPARSLAELCDISDDEGGLPGTHSLITQFENMKFKNGTSKRSVPTDF